MVELNRATMPEKVRYQIKYLRERLERAVRAQNVYGHWGGRETDKKFPIPPAVAEAQKRVTRDNALINRYQKEKAKYGERKKQAKIAAVRAIEEQMTFGKPEKALALLKAFEEKQF